MIVAAQTPNFTKAERTRFNLMRAAERLIATHGLANVTVKAITIEAEQKNESALQYHFNNREGLLQAIHQARNLQVQEKRTELLDKLLAENREVRLRDVCSLMIGSTLLHAQSDLEFRQYVKGFAQEVATNRISTNDFIDREAQRGTLETRRLLRESLYFLNEQVFLLRYKTAIRFGSLSIAEQSRQQSPFEGKQSDVFLSMLIDMMVGMFSAEISEETVAALKGTDAHQEANSEH